VQIPETLPDLAIVATIAPTESSFFSMDRCIKVEKRGSLAEPLVAPSQSPIEEDTEEVT
jgi:hypothetical protein